MKEDIGITIIDGISDLIGAVNNKQKSIELIEGATL